MSNNLYNYINNPIKLNLLNRHGIITKKYIFLGNGIKTDIKNKIKEIEKTSKINTDTEKVLKKEYGSKWKQILEINQIKGGSEEDLEPIEDDHVTLAEIMALNNIRADAKSIAPVAQKEQKNKIKIHYIFDDFSLYPNDNILEFKKKISIVTNIPIYKQNLWLTHNNKIYNLSYNIYIKNTVAPISIMDNIIKSKSNELINDIPIMIDFYNIKNIVNIKMHDTFTIIEDFTQKLCVYEFNLFNFDDFINDNILLKQDKDKNQLEIIYYGFVALFWPMFSFAAWTEYVNTSVENFERIYPDIALNLEKYKKMYKVESLITNSALDLFNNDELTEVKNNITENMFTSVTESQIQITSSYEKNIINLRNIFSIIRLNSVITSCKCSMFYDGKNIILNKTFMNTMQISTILPLMTIMIRVQISKITSLDLYLYTNGNYTIKTKWPDDKLYEFSDVLDIVIKNINPVITYINSMGSIVINSNYSLELMTKKNAKFSDIYVSLIYRNPIKFYEFKIIENIMKEYSDAGIVHTHNINHDINTLQYYFSKGMYKYDESKIENNIVLNNYYNFLTNYAIKSKWEKLYVNTRSTSITYRHGDIKISIAGIKKEEYDTFYLYIINIFNMLETQKKTYIPDKQAKLTLIKKNIKTLKYQDPVLYDFKKLYNSPIVYSRLCQKKNQPVILNTDEFEELSAEKKKNVLKYWNFTTKSPAYYQCPNPKFPYIQFSVKKHPKDYCIPCCKVKPITESTEDQNLKQIIYNTCLEDHIYTKDKGNLVMDARYIMAYGKFVSPGRICNLPEETVEPLLYESFSESSGLESRCKNKYYLYGIEQNVKYVADVGYLTSLANSLDLTIDILIDQFIIMIKKLPVIFKTILDGNIIKYFKSNQDLIKEIESTFINNLVGTILETKTEIPWNIIFIDMAYFYLNIISIVFEDDSSPSKQSIKLQLNNKINNTQLTDASFKCLFLVKKGNNYNPIYNINAVIYFKTKVVEKKLFSSTDNLINIITKINEFSTSNLNNENKDKKNELSLDIFKKFTNQLKINNDKNVYRITKYFINKHNLCYYIAIAKGQDLFYIPVTFSNYTTDSKIDIEYETFKIKKYVTLFQHLITFMKDFNHWIALESEKKGLFKTIEKKNLPIEQIVNPLYNYLKIDKWIYLDNPWSTPFRPNKKTPDLDAKNIIGFIHNNINYYHSEVSFNYINRYETKAPVERILYHPDKINTNLDAQNTVDNRVKNIAKNMYDFHLYELILLEFTTLLNKEKNIDLRHLIKKQILKLTDTNSNETMQNIKKYIENYYNLYDKNQLYSEKDYDKINLQVNNYSIRHRDKNELFKQIDSSTYIFDKVKINLLKRLPVNKLVLELTKISKRIVITSTDKEISKALNKTTEFPNMLISCQNKFSDLIYCKQNKLLITENNLNSLLNIMANDLLNEFKGKWLFSDVFSNNVISFLKFIKYPNEYIEISIR